MNNFRRIVRDWEKKNCQPPKINGNYIGKQVEPIPILIAFSFEFFFPSQNHWWKFPTGSLLDTDRTRLVVRLLYTTDLAHENCKLEINYRPCCTAAAPFHTGSNNNIYWHHSWTVMRCAVFCFLLQCCLFSPVFLSLYFPSFATHYECHSIDSGAVWVLFTNTQYICYPFRYG